MGRDASGGAERADPLGAKGPLDFSALIDDPTPASAYRALNFPVLILRGEHAPAPTRLIAEGLSELLPTSQLMVIDGAGHMGPLTHASEVSALIMRHIVNAEARCAAATLARSLSLDRKRRARWSAMTKQRKQTEEKDDEREEQKPRNHSAACRAAQRPATAPWRCRSIQTTSYQFRSTEHAANLFALKEFGNIYSRIMNPTCDALEQKIAALEGGVAALAVSSGQAASAMAIQNLCRPGDNIVSSTDLYGGTWNLFANTLASMGIKVRFADPADPEAFRRATDERTRAYYAETLPNPKLTGVSDRRSGNDRARSWRATDHGQHRGARDLSAVRPRRGNRGALNDQVHRRARHLDRRHHRRRRQLRLGGT